MLATLVKAVPVAVGGALVAAVGTGVHQLVVGSHRWPVGLLLGLGLTMWWGAVLSGRRVPGAVQWAGIAGWAGFVVLVSSWRPGGDVIVPANVRGYGWMGAGLVLLVVTALLPARDVSAARG